MFLVFKDMSWFFKKNWFKYVIVFVFTILFSFLLTLSPEIIEDVVDLINNGLLTLKDIYKASGFLLGLAIGIYLSAVIKNYLLGSLFHEFFYQIKVRFMNNIFRQDGDFFEEYYSGDLISRATGDTHGVARVSTYLLFALVDTTLTIFLSFFRMVEKDLGLTLLAIIPLPIIFVVVLIIRPKISANWRKVRKEISHLNNLVMESVANVKLVRGFNKEQEDYVKLEKSATTAFEIEKKSVLLRSVFSPIFNLVVLISQGVALGYGSYLILNNSGFTVGQLISFNMFLIMFSRPLFRLGNQITFISQSGISAERVSEILKAEPKINDCLGAIPLTDIKDVEFKDYSFHYPNEKTNIIEDINLVIKQGNTIGIVGKTGSGKSTLVKQLLRMYTITGGKICINGKPINYYQKMSIRENISYIPQENQLFSRTVLDNLLLGESKYSTFSIDDAIDMADFRKDIPYLENGLDTIVGEAGVTLSGGQKQRISIARAMYKNSEILIMDDALSAVDGITEKNILKSIKDYRKDKTNIIIAHRLTAVESADVIIVMDHGRIVEKGTHEELMSRKGWYYEQYIFQEMEDVSHD
ncbi:MAG: ABC transporter ATP-binding protein [Bacilli bacterium]|jgi:ATP-binding cassette subfamily B protein|nr:ABC transporter ATP-binding protein [Bacilli bacterium]MDD2682417.1 ABC transporter ATP-binding protein [Bacilli bacterium]MDD3121861.1 ABC transporter ATP-binding protein [Bacilli bacterium]MDD4063846.1 ABC transporter ATP-binding protein [Bacilli bacterium]MDD4482698.1 ABC transporter ATP-binding protein [Bacilli bacterium]